MPGLIFGYNSADELRNDTTRYYNRVRYRGVSYQTEANIDKFVSIISEAGSTIYTFDPDSEDDEDGIDNAGGKTGGSIIKHKYTSTGRWKIVTAGGGAPVSAWVIAGMSTLENLQALQAATDYCAANHITLIYDIEDLTIDGTWRIPSSVGNDSGFKELTVTTPAGWFIGGYKLRHDPAQLTQPMINIAAARSVVLSGINLRGNNLAPQTAHNPNDVKTDLADWVDPGISTDRYAPYAGICIDGLAAADDPGNENYTFAPYGENSSSKLIIEKMRVEGFYVGFCVKPSDNDQGTEDITLRDSNIIENTYSVVTTGTQQRNIVIERTNLYGSYCNIDGATFGQQKGVPAKPSNCNVGQSYKVYQIKPDVDVLISTGNYYETVGSLGVLGVGGSGARLPAVFQGDNFSFIGKTIDGEFVDLPIVSSMPLSMYGGTSFVANYQVGVLAEITAHFGDMSFRSLGTPLEQENFAISERAGGEHKISQDRTDLRAYSGSVPILLPDRVKLPSLPNKNYIGENTTEFVVDKQTFTIDQQIVHIITATISNVVYGTNTLTFQDDTVNSFLRVGDVLIWRILRLVFNDDTPLTDFLPGLIVTVVAGNQITAKWISDLDPTYSPSNVDHIIRHFINDTIATGDATVASADITNVTEIDNFAEGDWLTTSDQSLPSALRVVGIAGSTLTVHRALNATVAGIELYNTRLTTP